MKKSGLVIAVVGGIVIEFTGWSVFQIVKAMHRLKLNNAKKLEEYKKILKNTTEHLLDDKMKEIDKKKLEKFKVKIERKIEKLEKSQVNTMEVN